MKKTLIAVAAHLAALSLAPTLTRARTRDVAYPYRMPAGYPGTVNRFHPASILPGLNNPTNPVRLVGDPAIIDTATNSYRGLITSDTAVTKIDGLAVRSYPFQQPAGGPTASLSMSGVPATNMPIDMLHEGFMIARCNNFAAQQPTKGGAVYIWVAASTGAHVQGGFESVTSAGNTAGPITNMKWNGPGDANGITEIQIAAPLA